MKKNTNQILPVHGGMVGPRETSTQRLKLALFDSCTTQVSVVSHVELSHQIVHLLRLTHQFLGIFLNHRHFVQLSAHLCTAMGQIAIYKQE